MCDTMVAFGDATAAKTTLFAKNSDRDANEAQVLEIIPADTHDTSEIRLTYIAIPQVKETYRMLLSRPYWMWGAEMGVNEHGVAIGNEAIQSKVPAGREPGLIGMDMVRLGLERAASADEALEVICGLVEAHGQSGNCGHTTPFYYHNSFLIADDTKAWVLETIGHQWIARAYRSGCVSISNTMTIEDTFDRASDGLFHLAREIGWQEDEAAFDFKEIFSPTAPSGFASGPTRQRRSEQLMQANVGRLSAESFMSILRDRGPQAGRDVNWRPDGLLNGTICAHASRGPIRRFGQTTGSLIASLADGGRQEIYATGTSAPDTSIFKPVVIEVFPEDLAVHVGTQVSGIYNSSSLWWRHERLHRAILEDYAERLPAIEGERNRLEEGFMRDMSRAGGALETRLDVCAKAWATSDRLEEMWADRVKAITPRDRGSLPYQLHWRKLSKDARMPAP